MRKHTKTQVWHSSICKVSRHQKRNLRKRFASNRIMRRRALTRPFYSRIRANMTNPLQNTRRLLHSIRHRRTGTTTSACHLAKKVIWTPPSANFVRQNALQYLGFPGRREAVSQGDRARSFHAGTAYWACRYSPAAEKL